MNSKIDALIIDCIYNIEKIVWPWTDETNMYTCLGDIEYSGNGENLENVTGTHSKGMKFDDVEALYIRNQPEVKSVPLGLRKFLPNLTVIHFFKTAVKSLEKELFFGLPNLKVFNFARNNISEIGNDVFEFQRDIVEAFSLWQNPIQNVGVNTMKNLTKLLALDLQGTKCTRRTNFRLRKGISGQLLTKQLKNLDEILADVEKNCPPTLEMKQNYIDYDLMLKVLTKTVPKVHQMMNEKNCELKTLDYQIIGRELNFNE